MGRPLKLHNSPLRNLAMLRDEFMARSAEGEAYFARLVVQREPVLSEEGLVDKAALKALSDAIVDESKLLIISDWAEGPDLPDCYREFLWRQEDQTAKHVLPALEELSESAVRMLAADEFLANRLRIKGDDLVENLAWDSYWLDLLLKLGTTRTHPVVRTRQGHLSYGRRYDKCVFFELCGHTLAFMEPSKELLQTLRKLAGSKNHYEELACGILRTSAYALDWLIQEAEAKGDSFR